MLNSLTVSILKKNTNEQNSKKRNFENDFPFDSINSSLWLRGHNKSLLRKNINFDLATIEAFSVHFRIVLKPWFFCHFSCLQKQNAVLFNKKSKEDRQNFLAFPFKRFILSNLFEKTTIDEIILGKRLICKFRLHFEKRKKFSYLYTEIPPKVYHIKIFYKQPESNVTQVWELWKKRHFIKSW